jgi:hypothetical protein
MPDITKYYPRFLSRKAEQKEAFSHERAPKICIISRISLSGNGLAEPRPMNEKKPPRRAGAEPEDIMKVKGIGQNLHVLLTE